MKLTKSTFFLGCLVGGMGAAIVPLLLTNTHADTKLLPFQGRLTDATGSAVADGAKVVEFKMYDAPTGGNVKWAGEVHKLSVNGGLVNTMLGSKASLGGVDFSAPSYLQITVDSNSDNQITAADPPLLPRQSVVPAVYAQQAGQLQYSTGNGTFSSAGWDAVFNNGRPDTGLISPSKLETIPAGKLANGAVNTDQVLNGTLKREDFSQDALTGFIPTGVVLPWVGDGSAPYSPPAGWILCNGQTIGKLGSGATYSNDNAWALFNLIWTQWSPVNFRLLRSDGSPVASGSSPLADWEGGKRLILPDMRGRVAVGSGTGSLKDDKNRNLTVKPLGSYFGEEIHALIESEMPAHTHNGTTGRGNAMDYRLVGSTGLTAAGHHFNGWTTTGDVADKTDASYPGAFHTHDFTTNSTGGGNAHNISQPSFVLTYLIKL